MTSNYPTSPPPYTSLSRAAYRSGLTRSLASRPRAPVGIKLSNKQKKIEAIQSFRVLHPFVENYDNILQKSDRSIDRSLLNVEKQSEVFRPQKKRNLSMIDDILSQRNQAEQQQAAKNLAAQHKSGKNNSSQLSCVLNWGHAQPESAEKARPSSKHYKTKGFLSDQKVSRVMDLCQKVISNTSFLHNADAKQPSHSNHHLRTVY